MKNKKGCLIFWNILVTICLVIGVLMTLTYKEVPLNERHMWFGDDLHTYLIYVHSFYTIIFGILAGIGNFAILSNRGRE